MLPLAQRSPALHFGDMIASLMMYARPELEGAHRRFWRAIRASLAVRDIPSPPELSQTAGEFSVWEDPALVFSQTCGMPYRTRLHDEVQIVCTPDYGLDGCPAGYYRSAIVVRNDDPRTELPEFAKAQMAFNMSHSQSGFAALYAHTKPLGFWFTNHIQSGGHLSSAEMIARGNADIACLDVQTWRLIQRYEPMAAKLRVLEYTKPTPALPYITGPHHNPLVIYDALSEAFSKIDATDREALDLRGLVKISPIEYLAVANPPADAVL